MARPSVAEIKEAMEAGRRYWSAWSTQADLDLDLCIHGAQVQPRSKKKGVYTGINPPTAKNKCDAVANHLITEVPTITIDKSAFPESERPLADQLESALQAIWWRATFNSVADPHRASVLNACEMGMGALELNVDFSAMPEQPGADASVDEKREYDFRRRTAFPLLIRSVDPRDLIPDPGTEGERWMARKRKVTLGEVKATFAEWEPPPSFHQESDFQEVELVEWWTREWYYYEVEGVPINRDRAMTPPDIADSNEPQDTTGPWPNRLGFIPYNIFASGYGSGVGLPANRYMSLITAAREGNLFKAEAERHSQLHAIIDKMSWGALLVPPGLEELDLSPGAINTVQVNEQGQLPDPKLVGFANPPSGIFAELARIEDAIDRATIASVLDSAESGSAESALKFIRKTQEAMVALTPLRVNVSRAWMRLFQNVIQFFNNPEFFNPDETVFIYGQTPKGPVQAEIGPKLIKNRHIPVFVEVRAALPEDETLRIQTGASLLGRGIGTEMFFDKFMRVDDPKAATKELLKSLIRQQIIDTGVIAQYGIAVMTGQANPLMGMAGYLAQQQAAGGGATALPAVQNPPSAVEPNPEVRQPGPGQQAAMAAGVPAAGTVDAYGNLLRQMLARRAPVQRA